MTLKDAQKMISDIILSADYNVWKKLYDEDNDQVDATYNLNLLVEIVKEYTDIHYC